MCYHEEWPPKGVTLFETCFEPAGLQGDIAHATKLRRDSEYKSRFLYSALLISRTNDERNKFVEA
jgi:hypothetical protein